MSSEALAEAADVNSANVRKDLSLLGPYGTRGVGYDVAYLIQHIRRELGLTQHWPIVIAGIGNLGHALANYRGFAERGFEVAALVDADPEGRRRSPVTCAPARGSGATRGRARIAIGVIAPRRRRSRRWPTGMVAAGIRSILNFAPALISVPPGVSVRKVDLSVELQILAFYEQRKATLAEVKRRGKAVADVPARR